MLKAGDRIGDKYRLTREIGSGAMGVVWAAVNEHTSREVALKLVLRPTTELRTRLLKEAKITGSLSNRHIIEILDVGQTETGDPFLVMPLLVGETLADVLARQRRIDPSVAAEIARDVARALEVAHASGIIHRDLKPANIFLHREAGADETTVKVLDFGVSKNLSARDTMVASPAVAGGGIGSPAYMSPEQMRVDKNIDPRSDLWSLGVVLFEMLTGVRPFQGETQQIIRQVTSGEIPSVANLVRFVDPGLIELVARCLQRERDKRIGTATELVQALSRFTREPRVDSSHGVPSSDSPSSVGPTYSSPSSSSRSLDVKSGAYNTPSDAGDVDAGADDATLQYHPATAAKLISSQQRPPSSLATPHPTAAPPSLPAPPQQRAPRLLMMESPLRSTSSSAEPMPLPGHESAGPRTARAGAFGTLIMSPDGGSGGRNSVREHLQRSLKNEGRSSHPSRLALVVVAITAGLSVAILVVVVAVRMRSSRVAPPTPSASSSSSGAPWPATSARGSEASVAVPSLPSPPGELSPPAPSLVPSSTVRPAETLALPPPTATVAAAAQESPSPTPTKPPPLPSPTQRKPPSPPPKPSGPLIIREPIFE